MMKIIIEHQIGFLAILTIVKWISAYCVIALLSWGFVVVGSGER